MKRTFATFVQQLTHKERLNVPRGGPEDAQRWDIADDFKPDTEEQVERRTGRVLLERTSQEEKTRRADGCEEELEGATLGRIEGAVAAVDARLRPRVVVGGDRETGTVWSALEGAEDGVEACGVRDADGSFARRSDLGSDGQTGGMSDVEVRVHEDEEESAEDSAPGEGDCSDGDSDVEGRPLSTGMLCTWSGDKWTETMRRELEEVGMLPLPDEGDGEDEDGVKWVFKRAG